MKKWYLKRKLKKLYLRSINHFQEYSCGHKTLLNISSKYYNTCKKFNETADKLTKIDKDCPKFRYDLKP